MDRLLSVTAQDPLAHNLDVNHQVRDVLVLTLAQQLLSPQIIESQQPPYTDEDLVLERADGVGHLIHWGPVDQLKPLPTVGDSVDVDGTPRNHPWRELVVFCHTHKRNVELGSM